MHNFEQAGKMLKNKSSWISEQDTKTVKSDWKSRVRPFPHFVGDQVSIENQYGRHPSKWERTGTIVEILKNMLQKLTDLVVSTYEIDIFRRRSIRIRTIYQNAQPAPQNRSSLSDTATGSLLKIINIAQLLPTDTSGLSPMY